MYLIPVGQFLMDVPMSYVSNSVTSCMDTHFWRRRRDSANPIRSLAPFPQENVNFIRIEEERFVQWTWGGLSPSWTSRGFTSDCRFVGDSNHQVISNISRVPNIWNVVALNSVRRSYSSVFLKKLDIGCTEETTNDCWLPVWTSTDDERDLPSTTLQFVWNYHTEGGISFCVWLREIVHA